MENFEIIVGLFHQRRCDAILFGYQRVEFEFTEVYAVLELHSWNGFITVDTWVDQILGDPFRMTQLWARLSY